MDRKEVAGWKTSEFWVSLAAMAALLAQNVGIEIDNEAAVAAVGGLYAVARGLVKAFK